MNIIITTLKNWLHGIRIYIAFATALLTLLVLWWTNSVYGGSSLAAIRLQEIYAWISLGLLLVTVGIGPVCKLVPKLPGKALLRDARRIFGISAAWFASLHVGIAYIDQFKAINPFNLPSSYQLAFSFGAVALLILLAMAFTSFNAAFRTMGIWWFRLHRLVYLAILLILFHAFNIGVHATTAPFILALTVAVGLLFAAHFYIAFGPGARATTLQSIILCYGFLLTVGIFAYGFSQGLQERATDDNTNGVEYGLR